MKKFFVKNALTGMLEASYIDNVDQVALFLGSVVDVICENEDNFAAKTGSTLQVDLNKFLFRRHFDWFWSSKTLSELEQN